MEGRSGQTNEKEIYDCEQKLVNAVTKWNNSVDKLSKKEKDYISANIFMKKF